ncbi:MAG: Crp/Fnr family transcriptional regulator [Gammaproteobacteria bacterium]|nr:Crp/Fnr family transcriptional regulator [Gammaproteobacteria bacterium]MDH5652213.1 Crp/Fnr family transcriptional regulator [Gammaproteobacteria bacterium]
MTQSDTALLQELTDLLRSLVDIPDEEMVWLRQAVKPCSFPAGDTLFRTGVQDGSVHFICSGLVRYFYQTEEGLERNHTFAGEKTLVACLGSYITDSPCRFSVETLEPTRTLQISAAAVMHMEQRHTCWIRLKLRLMEHVALRKEQREADFLLTSAAGRYRLFLEMYPQLVQRIPQYHIASFLGITPVALSRIRRRLNPG